MINNGGYLHLILGPMFAGKTTKLFNIIENLKENNGSLKNEIVKLNHENKELKKVVKEYQNQINSCKSFLYGTIFINVATLIGVAYKYYKR